MTVNASGRDAADDDDDDNDSVRRRRPHRLAQPNIDSAAVELDSPAVHS